MKNCKKILIPAGVILSFTAIATLIMFIANPKNSYSSYWFGYRDNGTILFIYGNLWYIPMILICYLLTPFLQKTKNNKKPLFIFLVILSVFIELSFGIFIELFPYCYISYVIGYFVGSNIKAKEKIIDEKYYFWPTILSLSLTIITYIIYKYSYNFGNVGRYISNVFATLVGTSIFFDFAFLFKFFNKVNIFNQLFDETDKLGYPIYLLNQVFTTGSFSILKGSSFHLVWMSVLSIIIPISLIVNWISNLIIKSLNKSDSNRLTKT